MSSLGHLLASRKTQKKTQSPRAYLVNVATVDRIGVEDVVVDVHVRLLLVGGVNWRYASVNNGTKDMSRVPEREYLHSALYSGLYEFTVNAEHVSVSVDTLQWSGVRQIAAHLKILVPVSRLTLDEEVNFARVQQNLLGASSIVFWFFGVFNPRRDGEWYGQEFVGVRLQVLVHNVRKDLLEFWAQLAKQVNEGVSAAWVGGRRRIENIAFGVVNEEAIGPGSDNYRFSLERDEIQVEQVTLQLSVAARRIPTGVVQLLYASCVRSNGGQVVLKLIGLRRIGYSSARYKNTIGDSREDRRRL